MSPESEGNGENTNIEKPTHGRSTEGYLTDTSQKGSVGDVDDILRKQAQENRVTDTPDLFVGIHKEGFKFAGCKDTTFCVPSKFTGPFFVQFNSTHFP